MILTLLLLWVTGGEEAAAGNCKACGRSWPSVPMMPCGPVVGGVATPCCFPFSSPSLALACGYWWPHHSSVAARALFSKNPLNYNRRAEKVTQTLKKKKNNKNKQLAARKKSKTSWVLSIDLSITQKISLPCTSHSLSFLLKSILTGARISEVWPERSRRGKPQIIRNARDLFQRNARGLTEV